MQPQTDEYLNIRTLSLTLWSKDDTASLKKTERWISKSGLGFDFMGTGDLKDEYQRPAKQKVTGQIIERARRKRTLVLFATLHEAQGDFFLAANDARKGRRWVKLGASTPSENDIARAFQILLNNESKNVLLLPIGPLVTLCRQLARSWQTHQLPDTAGNDLWVGLEIYSHGLSDLHAYVDPKLKLKSTQYMTHLDRLEAESIHIIREVIAQADNPVMLYSVGKDSSVMLHLARKAFYPSSPPFPLLHIDTRWKFQAMYDFRGYMAEESGMELLVHVNPEGVEKNINPFDHGSALHTDVMKTQGLKQALDHYKFDVAFGGARRDEEKSRAKERVFSFRTETHRWDAKNQRPELWNLYNGRKKPGESIRVFPISNWTELDIWQYIYREQIPIVPLYFAADRPVVVRNGFIMMVDDDRLPLFPDEEIQTKKIRFRTLGCYPLTGAIESEADNLASIVLELLSAKTSERQGRAIDTDTTGSMEKKKEEGYF